MQNPLQSKPVLSLLQTLKCSTKLCETLAQRVILHESVCHRPTSQYGHKPNKGTMVVVRLRRTLITSSLFYDFFVGQKAVLPLLIILVPASWLLSLLLHSPNNRAHQQLPFTLFSKLAQAHIMPQPTNSQRAQPGDGRPSQTRKSSHLQQDPYINLGPDLQAKSPQELARHVAGMNLGDRLGDVGRRIEKAVGRGSAPIVREHTHHTVIINGSGSVQVPSGANVEATILTGLGEIFGAAGRSPSQADVRTQRPSRPRPSAQSGQFGPPLQPEPLIISSGSIFPRPQRRGGLRKSSNIPSPTVQQRQSQQVSQSQRVKPAQPNVQAPTPPGRMPGGPTNPPSTTASSRSTTLFTPPPSTQAGSTRGNGVDPRFFPKASKTAPTMASSASPSFLTPTSSQATVSNTGRIPVDKRPFKPNQSTTRQQHQRLPPSKGTPQRTNASQQSLRPTAATAIPARQLPAQDPFRATAKENPSMTQAAYDRVMKWNPGTGGWR